MLNRFLELKNETINKNSFTRQSISWVRIESSFHIGLSLNESKRKDAYTYLLDFGIEQNQFLMIKTDTHGKQNF